MSDNFTRPRGRNIGSLSHSLASAVNWTFIMRVSSLCIVVVIAGLNLLQAKTGYSQTTGSTFVNVRTQHVPLRSVFSMLEEQTDFMFVFPADLVEKYKDIKMVEGRHTVKAVLDNVLAGSELSYRESGKNVIVYQQTPLVGQRSNDVSAQNENISGVKAAITGRVIDDNGQPLPGVSVMVKNTNKGTATDQEGRYAIEAGENETLLFSFIGFKSVEVQILAQTVVDVSMQLDVMALAVVEIRSTGYWTESKERSTANIVKVQAKEIEKQPVTSPLMALQGRLTGVDIVPTNGVAGSAPKIQIRGNNSLRPDGSYPLYVVDGVPLNSSPVLSTGLSSGNMDPLASINPASIESIEVLKDAAATAIYGSRGANGVILIRTKQGSNTGKTNFEASVYTGIGQLTNRVDMLNTQQYLAMRREGLANRGSASPELTDFDLLYYDSTRNVNWQDELLGRSANILDVQAAISGGNARTSFRLGGSFHKETVIYPGDFGYHNLSGNLNVNHHSEDEKFHLTLLISYGKNSNKLFSDLNFVKNVTTLPPNAPKLYDENGQLNWAYISFFGNQTNSLWNPLAALKNTHDTESDNLISNASISYDIFPDLTVKLNSGFTNYNQSEIVKYPIAASPPHYAQYSKGRATFGDNTRQSWILEPQVLYQKNSGNHQFNFVLGTTLQVSEYSYRAIRGDGYTSDVLLNSIRAAATQNFDADEDGQYKYFSLYARIGYDWKGKYLIDLIGRRDGSSRFGPENRFGNFGAVGAGWIFSKESVIKNNVKFLSFGKIRGSYGVTGNDQIGDYRYYNLYDIAAAKYQGNVNFYPTSLYNPNFKWESTTKTELSMELGFFDNRIRTEVTWFRNRSSNQLVDYKLPTTTGFGSIYRNFDATIENSGWEVSLTTVNISKKSFTWNTSFNITVPKNVLLRYNGIESSPYAFVYKEGEPLSINRVLQWTGVDPQTGVHTYLDVNEDGELDDADRRFDSRKRRKYLGGLLNTVQYRNFELSFLLQFVSQKVDRVFTGLPGIQNQNQPVGVLDRWQNEGDNTDVQKFWDVVYDETGSAYGSYLASSSYNIQDGSFVRLKTASLVYHLPSELVHKAKVNSAQVYLHAQNLFTITNFVGLDPETGNVGLPPIRIMTVGLQVKL